MAQKDWVQVSKHTKRNALWDSFSFFLVSLKSEIFGKTLHCFSIFPIYLTCLRMNFDGFYIVVVLFFPNRSFIKNSKMVATKKTVSYFARLNCLSDGHL